MKKSFSGIALLVLVVLLFCFNGSNHAFATTAINKNVYIKQAGQLTCTLASATMVIRARAQLSGYNDYTSITENDVSKVAWTNAGLSSSFTYTFDGNSITVKKASTGGSISLSDLESILDDHPEGIALYCRGGGEATNWSDAHAVFVTDYEDDTIYCKDPAYSSGRIQLSSSRLGALYGGQANILDNTTHYWYISSYSVSPTNPKKNILSGVYVIHSAWDDNYVLDIAGNSKGNNANIQLYRQENTDVQKFRVIRWDNDSYCIQSIYSEKWLDVALPIENKANVKLFYDTGTPDDNPEDHWYFEDAGNGYVFIKNITGLYLDLENNTAENRSNVSLYEFVGKSNKSQKWRLEDVTDYYDAEDGLYTIATARNTDYQLDIYGNKTENRANIQLYEQLDTTVQLFELKRKGSYYVIKSVYADKWLDIKYRDDGTLSNNSTVQLWESNNAPEQQWVLENAGNGYVYIRSNADYYLDVQYDQAKNNANVQVYHFANNNSQRWLLRKAEFSVIYNANGGTGEPLEQTKVYGTVLTLSNEVPVLENRTFVEWNTMIDGSGVSYNPGDSFRANEDTILYAIWERGSYTITYDANGGSEAPAPQFVESGSVTLPSEIPIRPHYRFLGWSVDQTEAIAEYAPGDLYDGDIDICLYAVWERKLDNIIKLPSSLQSIDSEAFIGTDADAFIIPVTVIRIGENAFDDVVIYGFVGSYAEIYAKENDLVFYPITE